jgi:uncharacterized membrane protein
MSWFFIALIGPFIYTIANHTDKFLISKYLKGGKVGSLIIFSSFFSVVALPVVIFFKPDILNVSFLQAVMLAVNGMLIVFSVLFYFYALSYDDASSVVPFYQTIPIFAFILGYFFLGETITVGQGVASFVIILGALVLSFDLGVGARRFKKEVVLLMLGASLLYAINGVIFKFIAIDSGFWISTFWGLFGKIILGLGFLLFVPIYRNQFLAMVKENNFAVLGLNSLSETMFILGEGVTQYATLLAPVALVLLVNSFQPVFVFVTGIALAIFLPQISSESIKPRVLAQKFFGIGLIVAGAYFIAS